jgi:glycosyltransferase involved in cell wall biosynthesis
MKKYQIGFILEQALGHITHAQNLRVNIPRDPDVQAHWALVPWETTGIGSRIPVYKSNWTVRAGLRARSMVARMTRQHQLDALFFHSQVPAVPATNWIKRFPSIVSLDATPRQYDSLGAFYAHDEGPAWLEDLKWRMNRDCYRAARHLVTWSGWAKQGLIDDYEVPAEKITVIPPGVNSREWLRATPRTPHAGPVKILFVGGNLERKGGLLLLDAFRALRDHGVELHLATRDSVAPEPGIFVYNNMQPNSDALKQLYHDCDIFCLPTYGDCLPMVLSEAGAAGMPTVATQVAGIPEIVREGETGFLVPTGDPHALTEALRRLVLDAGLRLAQGERAVDVVTREFDAQYNAIRLLELLKREADSARIESKVSHGTGAVDRVRRGRA